MLFLLILILLSCCCCCVFVLVIILVLVLLQSGSFLICFFRCLVILKRSGAAVDLAFVGLAVSAVPLGSIVPILVLRTAYFFSSLFSSAFIDLHGPSVGAPLIALLLLCLCSCYYSCSCSSSFSFLLRSLFYSCPLSHQQMSGVVAVVTVLL